MKCGGLSVNKKYLRIFIVVIMVLALAVVGFLVFKKINPGVQPNDKSGGPVSGMYDKDGLLIKNVTSKDYFVIQERLSEYLESRKLDRTSTVTITTVNPYPRDGTKLDFKADIPALNIKGISFSVDYSYNPYPKFSVPDENYFVPLYGTDS